MADPAYIIGIDLGTTNSIVAYTEAEIEKGEVPDIRVLEIPQIVEAGTVEKRSVLPSFIFLPGRHDVSEEALELPWNVENKIAVGEFARERGAEIPNRLISSSKSWLCNTMVDRSKPILPWEAAEDTPKMSPVEASAEVLRHIRDAWNYVMVNDTGDPSLKMENQEVYLTVPASFDAAARELTVKAAHAAGLTGVTLLEEPQAAFYAWIEASGDDWREMVSTGDRVLVCDVGGGTSDFSLIRVSDEEGNLVLERSAVGDHLLVGGDNMDLALAYSLAQQMAQKGTRLDNWQMRGLGYSCRKAKEDLLSDSGKEAYPVTILGRGTSLIGGTIKTKLLADDVEKIILDGFFPECERTASPMTRQKIGIQEMGLAYEADPAITRHLAKFVSQHQHSEDENVLPTAILFNGGVMKSPAVRERVIDVISSWRAPGESASSTEETAVREIQSHNLDLSVARGAAYYGLARKGRGVRIRGGLGKTYYIGVAAAMPAVPGMPVPTKALCIAPFGMEEGTQADLREQEFMLVVGEPVKFDILASSSRFDDEIGTVVEDWEGEIEEVSSIETVLDGEHGSFIPVTIEINVTEIGTLEFWCVSKADDGRRWKLEFSVREKEA